jgi:methylenetetrahydrofolate reductase (NADPH)
MLRGRKLTSSYKQDEAFELGRQWSRIYEHDSASSKLIAHIMDTYFLVNLVHNNFKDTDAIFAHFLSDEPVSPITNGNGHANGVPNGVPNGIPNGVPNGVQKILDVVNGSVPVAE